MQKTLDCRCGGVDPRGDDPLQCRRDRCARTLIDEHVNVLLNEERVALRPRHDLVDGPVRSAREKGAHELLRLTDLERLERDSHGVRSPCPPGRPSLEKVGSRQAKQKQRRVQLFDELLEQGEKRLFGPVKILEHDRPRR